MNTQLVIFDLDGTLLNTIADLAASANYALEKLGYPRRSETQCRAFVGNGVTKLLERALPDGAKTPENVALMRAVFQAHYDAHNADATFAYPGMADLLAALAQKGIKLAVASNKYQSATEKLVRLYFPQVEFCAVLGARENVPVKPDPQIVRDILQAAGVAKENVLYVGDSDVDMQTAQNAQVKACAVTWGFRTREQLLPYAPAAWADKATDILNAL